MAKESSLPGPNPEYEALKRELSRLQADLSDCIAERDHLFFKVAPNVEAEYINNFGVLHQQLMELEISERSLRFRISLAQEYINRQQIPDMEEIERKTAIEEEKWRVALEDYLLKMDEAQHHFDYPLSHTEAELIRTLYRKLVRLLHPDVNPNFNEEAKILWERTLRAYKMTDLAALLDIEQKLASDDTAIMKSPDSFEELQDMLRMMEEQIAKVRRVTEGAKMKFPLMIRHLLQDKQWVANRKTELQQQIDNAQSLVQYLTNTLNLMIINTN